MYRYCGSRMHTYVHGDPPVRRSCTTIGTGGDLACNPSVQSITATTESVCKYSGRRSADAVFAGFAVELSAHTCVCQRCVVFRSAAYIRCGVRGVQTDEFPLLRLPNEVARSETQTSFSVRHAAEFIHRT